MRPRLRTRIAATAAVVALGGLAGYTLFSGPTTVPVQGPAQAAPARTVPPQEQREPEERGERGD